MKYIVYQTTNLINNKIYIGVHMTEDPTVWDFYLGDGCFANRPSSYLNKTQPFPRALVKYGVNNFKRETLSTFDTEKEALKLEALLVNEEFIKRTDTYNITLGGGKPPINYNIVYQYNLDGDLIKTWESVQSIVKYYGCHKDQIGDCVREKRSFKESFWSKEKFNKLNISEYRISESVTTKVKVYDKDRNLLKCFDSVVEAAQYYNEDKLLISSAMFEKCMLHNRYYLNYYEDVSILDRELNHTVKTKVYQYDAITGEYIQSFDSIKEASLAAGYKSLSGLSRPIKEKKIAKGYRWSYYQVPNILKVNLIEVPDKPKKIEQLDLEGNSIKIWDIDECRKQYPNCIKVCRGTRNKAYGYVWKYIS